MLCHLITGIIGPIAVLRRSRAIAYALLGTVYYVAWGRLGAFSGEHIRHH